MALYSPWIVDPNATGQRVDLMARSFNGTSDYAEVTSAAGAGYPVTISAWVKPAAVTAEMTVACGCQMSDSTLDANALGVIGNVTNDPLRAYTVTGGSGFNSSSINGVTAGSWQHVAGVWAATNSRRAYLDGDAGNLDTATDDPSSAIDTFVIGARRHSATTATYFNGLIAEVAVWSVALSGSDIAALAAGAHPSTVAGGPDFYWSLRTDGTAEAGGQDLTFNGTTHSADHPDIDASSSAKPWLYQGVTVTLGAGTC